MNLARISLAALVLASGCALTSKATALGVRWFTPEPTPPERTRCSPASGPALRVGRVTAGSELGERIVYGDGRYEVGYYETLRWTDRPERYLRSALDRVLFEERGFQRAVTGMAPTLDVELLSFQEVKTAQTHLARVAFRGVLSTDHQLLAETFAVDQPITGTRFDDVVDAIARALDTASNQLALRAGDALSKPQAAALELRQQRVASGGRPSAATPPIR